jgi:hypothetical protein
MMKKSVIPSGARDLAIVMSAFANPARIDEAKAFQRYRNVLIAYEGSLVVFATRDDTVFK